MTDLLFEIGCEELPTACVKNLSLALANGIAQQLAKSQLSHGEIRSYATPRRLAVLVFELQDQQPHRQIERQGPALEHAYDKQGTPTLACLGFAKSCGVPVDRLQIRDTAKGKRLYCAVSQPGLSTKELLPGLLQETIKQLPLPKAMRWGNHDTQFVRPVHWVTLIYGREVIDTTLLGCQTGCHTYGHRFHYPKALRIAQAKEYQDMLLTQGFVVADYTERQQQIQQMIEQTAAKVGRAILDPALLDEVTSLVEWPVALLGEFDAKYLTVPQEALITAMREHQKCFPIVDQSGKLLPNFILISNINSKDPQQVIAGNQRVINARLADAAFFYHNDLRHSLESRLDKLSQVVFQQQLGDMAERSRRIAELATEIAKQINANPTHAQRAGLLSKCDLVSEMVTEFPDLQGIMGYYYAHHDQEPDAVAQAIKEHYWPRFAGDELPQTLEGAAVSLANRIDSLIGIIGINKLPSGEKDPFALRRAALGVVRTLIEKQLDLDIKQLFMQAASLYKIDLPNQSVVAQTFDFIIERMRSWFSDKQIPTEVFEAVLACQPSKPLEFQQRVQAVLSFQQLPEASALAAANKRVSNILKKINGTQLPEQLNQQLFEYPAEKQLAEQLQEMQQQIGRLYQQSDYTRALTELAALKQPVDHFFDEVMVMVDNEPVRLNRLALLSQLRHLFTQVADISLLPS